MSNVWKTLSAIDCGDHIEKKGKFSYLSWTWAWAMVKENYPDASYQLEADTIYSDGTMEVRVSVSIEGMTHTMWLPVLDHQNKAITGPNSFDINSSRMRCLVKCLAMFGLGHYVYAGESVPQAPRLENDEYDAIVKALAEKDGIALLKLQEDLGQDKWAEAFNRPEKGKKTEFKETMRAVEKAGNGVIDAYVIGIQGHIENNDPSGVLELLEELSDDAWLKSRAWARMTDIQKHHIKSIVEAAA